MHEPDNHTAWVDKFGDTWIRTDDMPGMRGPWWPLTDGPGWDEWARGGVGSSWSWEDVEEGGYLPFAPASPERTARALERVRREVQS